MTCRDAYDEASGTPPDLVTTLTRLRTRLPFAPREHRLDDSSAPVTSTCSHA
ncbi:MAG: hypothetical protein AB9M60_08930 [Leptothrix sp. (in: b-proteobacteria)]